MSHCLLQAWIQRMPGTEPTVKTAQMEVSRFSVWDPKTWKMVTKELNLSYTQIERPPSLKR